MANLGGPTPTVTFVPFDPRYTKAYSAEADAIITMVRPRRIFVDHVGSTAVKGLGGKPVIDLLVSVQDWSEVGGVIKQLIANGYVDHGATRDPSRRFLSKLNADGLSFNVHLAPAGSGWGRDMLVFRDNLVAAPDLVERYTELKKRLVELHRNDIESYTAGKDDFVRDVLREARGSFSIDRLLTHQRAELDESQIYQMCALGAQLAVATIAAISVYSTDNRTMLNLAVIGFLLAGLWLFLARRQRHHRSVGDQARRVALLTSGLGARFSPEQRLRIFERFTVSIADRKPQREEVHFASRLPYGYARLAEMIEESGYWTRDLQATSVKLVSALLAVLIVALGLVIWRVLNTLSADSSVLVARASVAFLVFLMSSDVIGTLLSHREAVVTITEILLRLETVAARGHPDCDVLLLITDYNAAVESAPLALPIIYKLREPTLTKLWRHYLENKQQ